MKSYLLLTLAWLGLAMCLLCLFFGFVLLLFLDLFRCAFVFVISHIAELERKTIRFILNRNQ